MLTTNRLPNPYLNMDRFPSEFRAENEPKNVVREVRGCLNSGVVFLNPPRQMQDLADRYLSAFCGAPQNEEEIVLFLSNASGSWVTSESTRRSYVNFLLENIVEEIFTEAQRDMKSTYAPGDAGRIEALVRKCSRKVLVDQDRGKFLFDDLAKQWQEDTLYYSSITEMCMHPAYQRIIGMGRSALPFIFRELQKEADHWFWALKSITGCDPVPESVRGNVEEMAKAWIQWGQSEGYVTSEPGT